MIKLLSILSLATFSSTSLPSIAINNQNIKIANKGNNEDPSQTKKEVFKSLNSDKDKSVKRYLKGIFDDANLIAKIEQELKEIVHEDSEGTFIYEEDAQEVRYLNLEKGNISSFRDLNFFPNLNTLSIKFNEVPINLSDLTTLKNKLEWLEINGSKIINLNFIRQFNALKVLNLISTEIFDTSPLSTLIKLERLSLTSNLITDISPLLNLENLEFLELSFNNIHDISALSKMTKIMTLGLTSNNFSSLLPLANLINLHNLYLPRNNIRDLTPLANLISLEVLGLASNYISDLTPLANLTNLNTLDLRHNKIPNTDEAWQPIRQLPNYNPSWDNENVRSTQN